MSQTENATKVTPPESLKCAKGAWPYSVSYLRLQWDNDRIRVSRTRLGKEKLPVFWRVWLRELMLKKTESHRGIYVSFDHNHVIIGAENMTREGLIATVRQLAAQIYPPLKQPLERVTDMGHTGTGLAYFWQTRLTNVKPDIERIRQHLPRGSSFELLPNWDTYKLTCHGAMPHPQEVREWVEYFVTLDLDGQLDRELQAGMSM